MALHLVPRSLLYIESVAQLGSIQAASRELSISASSVYRQILLTEESVGMPLFERSASGMTPTGAGEMFIRLAREWREDSMTLWSRMQELGGGVAYGYVRLATMDSLVNGFIPEFLRQMSGEHPRLQIDVEVLSPDQAVSAVHENTCDLAVAFNVKPHKGLDVLWSSKLPLGCVASPSHPVAKRSRITLNEASNFPIVLQSRALSLRRYLEKYHKRLFAEEPQRIVTNSLQLLKRMAALGGHVALTSELDAAPEIRSGALVFVPVSDRDVAPQSISVIVSTRRRTSAAVATVAALLCKTVEADLAQTRKLRRSQATPSQSSR